MPTRVERRWALPEAAAVGQCGPQPAHGETVVVLGPVAGPMEIRHKQGIVGEELQQADGQGVKEGHVGAEKNDRVVRPRCMGKGLTPPAVEPLETFSVIDNGDTVEIG